RSSTDAATALVVPPARETNGVAPLHPVVLDHGILTALLLAVRMGADTRPLLPFSIERLRWWKAPRGRIGTAAVQRSHGEDAASFEFSILDEDGSPIAEVDGFIARRASADAVRSHQARAGDATYRVQWPTLPAPRTAPGGVSGRTVVVAAEA